MTTSGVSLRRQMQAPCSVWVLLSRWLVLLGLLSLYKEQLVQGHRRAADIHSPNDVHQGSRSRLCTNQHNASSRLQTVEEETGTGAVGRCGIWQYLGLQQPCASRAMPHRNLMHRLMNRALMVMMPPGRQGTRCIVQDTSKIFVHPPRSLFPAFRLVDSDHTSSSMRIAHLHIITDQSKASPSSIPIRTTSSTSTKLMKLGTPLRSGPGGTKEAWASEMAFEK